MRDAPARRVFPAAALVLTGCFSASDAPPSGPGTDSVRAEILFRKIQDSVFNPVCALCHGGPAPAQGMNLEADSSREVVNKPSSEIPELRIVKPGDPDSSYMIWKLEGRPGISGERMPWGMAPLPDSQIQWFRDWIG